MKKTIDLNKLESLAINGLILEEADLRERMKKRRDEALKELFSGKGIKDVPVRWGIVQDSESGYPIQLAYEVEEPAAHAPAPEANPPLPPEAAAPG